MLRRIVPLVLVLVLAMSLTAGCSTRTRHVYGEVYNGPPQSVTQTYNVPLAPQPQVVPQQPMVVPQQPMVVPQQPMAFQQSPPIYYIPPKTMNLPQVGQPFTVSQGNVTRYNHTEEEFHVRDVTGAIVDVVSVGALAASVIDGISDNHRGHRRYRDSNNAWMWALPFMWMR